MKKAVVLFAGAALLLGSCGTYTGSGAYNGAALGSIFGSAIGGINGGYHGSNVGTIVGMAGGAVIGGVIGAQADKAQQQKYEDYKGSRRHCDDSSSSYGYERSVNDESGFDPSGSGDDVLYDYDLAPAADTFPTMRIGGPAAYNAHEGTLEIRNLRFVDADGDNVMRGGEICKVVFEVYNNSSSAFYDIRPMVEETSGNKRIYISEGIRVEKILPGKGIRYTAMVKADRRIKDGTVMFRVYAAQGGSAVTEVMDFSVTTEKRR